MATTGRRLRYAFRAGTGIAGRRATSDAPASRVRPRAGAVLGVYLVGVFGATALLIWATLLGPLAVATVTRPSWTSILFLAVLIAGLENWETDLFGGSRLTLAFVPVFAMGVVVGPGVAGLVSVLSILVASAHERRTWYKYVFNACLVPLSAMVGLAMFYAITGGPSASRILRDLPVVLLSAETAFLVNSWLVALAVSISTGRGPYPVWDEKFRWLAPHYGAFGLAAYASAISFVELGFVGVAIFAMPVAMLALASRQYTSRARAGVERLQEANRALGRSEQRFRSLVQNAPGFIAVLDADASIQYLSPGPNGERRTFEGEAERDFLALARPEELPQVTSVLAEVLANPDLQATMDLRLTLRDGTMRDYTAIVQNLLEDDAVHGIVVNAHDVTDRKALEDQLRHQAFHDPLTQLPNRALFLDRLAHALSGAARRGAQVAVLFIDLDRFKVVNDSLGHAAGDDLLVTAARRITEVLRPDDTVARLGGDEFVILLEDLHSPLDVDLMARKLLQAFSQPLEFGVHSAVVTASIGVALSTPGENDSRDLVRRADVAVFRAKEEGRARHVVFDDAIDASSMKRFELEADLRQAVKEGQLRVFYQPELDLETLQVVGFEALVRWEHPTRGLVPPNDFIPLAEETGEIVPIGQWVLAEACRQAREWQKKIPALGHFTMAVNLSAKEFMEPDLTWRVAKTLRDANLRPELLRIEITESVLMRDVTLARKVFFELKGLGVEIAIDDFGTGYSSLNYLRRLPADVLKVDRSFVTDVDHDEREANIVRAVVNVARALELKVVAEGIERPEQVQILSDIGCATAQGFYFSRPQPADVIEGYVRERSGGLRAAS